MKEMRIGRMTLQIRAKADDPLTETARLVDRFPITTDEQWASWKSQGHCGKPASAYSLYCDNHEPMHHNDDPMTPVSQAIDNRLGGRQRVVMCAHIKAPKPSNIVTPTAPIATPNHTAITNARTEKEITMSTTNNTPANVNLDAITAQIAALNAALAALSTPASVTTTPANVPASVTTTPANVTTTPANVPTTPANTAKKPVMIHFDGGLIGTFTANAASFSTGNTGWRGQIKAEDENGDKYQITFMASKVGGNPNKPPTTKAKK
jgi:hypothetical protein